MKPKRPKTKKKQKLGNKVDFFKFKNMRDKKVINIIKKIEQII